MESFPRHAVLKKLEKCSEVVQVKNLSAMCKEKHASCETLDSVHPYTIRIHRARSCLTNLVERGIKVFMFCCLFKTKACADASRQASKSTKMNIQMSKVSFVIS